MKPGWCERKVEMAKPLRQHCTLAVVTGVVGDSPVEVVDDPDLQGGADQMKQQAGSQRLGQPRISHGGTSDDDPTDSVEGYGDEKGNDYQWILRPIGIRLATWPAQVSGNVGAFASAGYSDREPPTDS